MYTVCTTVVQTVPLWYSLYHCGGGSSGNIIVTIQFRMELLTCIPYPLWACQNIFSEEAVVKVSLVAPHLSQRA